MGWLPSELRLAAVLGVSAWVLIAGYRFARRRTRGDSVAAASDALLIFYLVQYVVIGIAGILGMLSAPILLLGAAALAAAMQWGAKSGSPVAPSNASSGAASRDWVLRGALILVIAYLLGLAWVQRPAPPLDNDSLTYHLPAAVQWIQHGRIDLFQTWLHNPANTYSPLAGSMFVVWLMAPLGNDALARYVQMPALVLIFLSLIDVARAMNGKKAAIVLVASAAVLCRPFFGQVILQKDDLFAAAFFTAAFAGLSRSRLSDQFGLLRVGVAVGLLLATKYTSLLSLPLLLLAIDAPIQAGRKLRYWIIAIGVIVLLVGPWLVRNYLVAGNPVYPIDTPLFQGMFSTQRSERLSSWFGVYRCLARGYYSPSPLLWCALVAGWIGFIASSPRAVPRDPLVRTVTAGPVLGIALFVAISPYDEMRFIYPSLILLWIAVAVALSRLPALIGTGLAGALLALSLATNFIADVQREILPVVISIFIVMLIGSVIWMLLRHGRQRIAAASLAGLIAAGFVFVYWEAFLRANAQFSIEGWQIERGDYMPLADAWAFVRAELPEDQTLAYANSTFVYPLYGYHLRRRLVYAPTSRRVEHLHDLPPIEQPLAGERISAAVATALAREPDRDAWLARLRSADARFLIVEKRDRTGQPDAPAPVELTFAEQDPRQFRRIFDNPAAAVFQILR